MKTAAEIIDASRPSKAIADIQPRQTIGKPRPLIKPLREPELEPPPAAAAGAAARGINVGLCLNRESSNIALLYIIQNIR